MLDKIEATCQKCGKRLRFEIIERPWNGQTEIVVEPCEKCLGDEYDLGYENAEEENAEEENAEEENDNA